MKTRIYNIYPFIRREGASDFMSFTAVNVLLHSSLLSDVD